MVPTVTLNRARGAASIDRGVAFRMVVIGTSSAVPSGYSTGQISTPYASMDAIVADFGLGDGVDAVCQALSDIGGIGDNPAPPPVTFVSTNGTGSLTAGVRGTTTGTFANGTPPIISNTASTHPAGTWTPYVKVKDDGNSGAGTAVGVAGIILSPSLDNGRTFLPDVALGTATTFKIQLLVNGVLTDTGVQWDFTNGAGQKMQTGDHWSETKTTPPQWAVAALYTAGTPATGLLMNICNGINPGLVVITEPAAASDIATLSAALDAMKAAKASCRPTLIVRFRDQGGSESDATYTAALATFRNACADDARIVAVAGDGWVTDAFRAFIYSRSGLAPLLPRLQGDAVLSGRNQERIAQDPGYAARGPLPGFTIKDPNGNPLGHDEKLRPGAEQPVAGKGGFLCFFYEGADDVKGTYVAASPSLYGTGSALVTLMDNRVSSELERILYSVAFQFLSGAEIVTNSVLNRDAQEAMSSAATKAIQDGMPHEFANWDDPNLVTIDPNVTVSGSSYTVKWYVNDKLYLYTKAIVITVANAR
jgi:hypothetical protein